MKFLKHFDANPYSIQLNYKNKLDFKSRTGGCISFLFYLTSAIIISLNIYYLFTQTEYLYTQQEIKNDLGEIYIDPKAMGLLVTGANDTHVFNITVEEQTKYGIMVYVEHVVNVNGSDNPTTPAVRCEGYREDGFVFDFGGFFCFPQDFDMRLSGRSDVIMEGTVYNRLGMIVKNISAATGIPPERPLKNLTAKLIFINNMTSPRYDNPIIGHKIRIFYIRDGIALNPHQLQQLTLYFKKLWCITDTDRFFLSQTNTINTTFYDQEYLTSVVSQNYREGNDHWLVQIKWKRSLYTLKYDRNYKKIATYLAESLGVIGLISLVFLVYRGYNKWSFTEKELLPKKCQKKTNIFRYYLQRIRQLKKITTNSQIYSQFEHKMDIHKILARLDDFEERIRALEGRSILIHEEGQEPQHAVPRKEYEQRGIGGDNKRGKGKRDGLQKRLINETEQSPEKQKQQDIYRESYRLIYRKDHQNIQ